MSEEKPMSQKINEYVAKDYFVTAASWAHLIRGQRFESYEIGIRSKAMNGDFTLLQSEKYNHQSVQECAEAVCYLLDAGFSVEWLQEHLT